MKLPLKAVLIVPFVVQILLVAGLVGYLSFRNGHQAVNDLALQLRDEVTHRIKEHLNTFLNTPHQINRLNAAALADGFLNIDDPRALERYFRKQILVFPSVSSIYFGNPRGGLANSGRQVENDTVYVISTDDFARGPFKKYATDEKGNRTELLATVPDFDARTRPWYVGAVTAGDAAWSAPYILFTRQDMAIAASRPVYDESGDLLGVVSVDIFASHLSRFLNTLKIGENGLSFIIERSGLLIASSGSAPTLALDEGSNGWTRLAAKGSEVPLVREAAEFLSRRFGGYHNIAASQHLEFDIDGHRQFLQVSPVQDPYGIDWLVVVAVPEADFMARIHANNQWTIGLVAVSLVLAVLLGIATAHWIAKPVSTLNDSAQALARGQWKPNGEDGSRILEIGELTLSFNAMAERLQATLDSLTVEIGERRNAEKALRESNECLEATLSELKEAQDRMMQQERLVAIGQLAAGVAHEFNNLLSTILGYTELLGLSRNISEEDRQKLSAITRAGQRGARLVRQILDFSRKSLRNPRPLDLASLLENISRNVKPALPENVHIRLEVEAKEIFLDGDPDRIRKMLDNLISNAADAMRSSGGELEIRAARKEVEDAVCVGCNRKLQGDWIRVDVSDTGCGIPPDVLPRIFEPFFTTKPVGEGNGLGLSQVYGIVKQHGGHIAVESQMDEGTTITLYFPPRSGE